ncbi:MAG: EamA family transporter [Burkholderiales bacterium]|nr:EamA family transporter [Burkholderiales bacterium]
MNKKNNLNIIQAYCKVSFVMLGWAAMFQIGHLAVEYVNFVSFAFLRYLIATLILLVLLKLKNGVIFNWPKLKQHWVLFLALGAIGIAFYNICYFGAINYISPNLVATIFALTPCVTTFVGSILFKTKVTKLGYLGIVIAFLGTIGVLNYSNAQCEQYFCLATFSNLSVGEILAFGTIIGSTIYSILSKRASNSQIDSLSITTYASIGGTFFLFIANLKFGNILHAPGLNQPIFWLCLLYSVIIGTVFGYKWYSDAVEVLHVAKTSVFLNGIPFFAVLIGVVILGQRFRLATIVCGLFIILGVLLTNFVVNKANKKSLPDAVEI